MNSQDLIKKLAIAGGVLTLNHDTLDAKFGNFLTTYYGGSSVVISGATAAAQADGSVVVSGKSSFTNIADLPITARFKLGADGQVSAQLRYTLRGSSVEANPWIFSRSFPTLPTFFDYSTLKEQPLLDQLNLFDTAFVVATESGQDTVLNVPLLAGINFVSHLRPAGLLGVFESVSASNPVLVLYGPIRIPNVGDVAVPLQPLEHPWNRLASTTAPLPAGIYLQASLDLGFHVGKLTLKDTMFRIYSPISTDWMEKNASFAPLHGYTGTLDIPSAGILVALGADIRLGIGQALLYGQLQGVSVGKLAHLLDLTGSDGLLDHLPDVLKKPVDALEKLELTYVALDLVLSDGVPSVRTAFAQVGLPSLKWKIWKDDLVVENLACLFAIFSPFAATSTGWISPALKFRVAATLSGTLDIEGTPLSISASNDNGYTVRAMTLAPASLPLDKLVKSHAPGVPVPSALTVNYLGMTLVLGKSYSLDALLSSTPQPWTIAVGKEHLTVSDVALAFNAPASGSSSGTFSGKIAFLPDVTLQVTYNFPGGLYMRSVLPPMKLGQVIGKLCNAPVKLPSGLDLDLDYSSIIISEQSGSMLFQLCTDVQGLGTLAFEARGASGGAWGFAYGLDLSATKPSQVPGLSALAAFEKLLHLQKLMLVVSSIDQPGFQLPDTAQFGNPQLAAKKVALPGSGVSAGLNVFGEWSLDSGDKQQNLCKSLLGLSGTLDVAIQVGDNPANSRLSVKKSGKLCGHPFDYQLGMQLQNGVPSFFLVGSVTLPIHKQPQTFDLTTLFVPNGAFLSATLKGSTPVDCGLFKLADLALEVGVDLAGLPSLGVTGSIDVKNFESSVAVFFDAADPSKSLVAGAVSDLTLKDVVDTLLGKKLTSSIDDVLSSVAIKGTGQFAMPASVADSLDHLDLAHVATAFKTAAGIQIPSSSAQVLLCVNKPGESWHLTDLTTMRHYQLKKSGQQVLGSIEAQFYFAPQQTAIGNINFPQGFYINGALKFLGFHAQATINISGNQGISVQAAMDKLSLGKGVVAMTSADGKSGAQVSISTMSDPGNAVAAYRQPHFYVNGGINLFGIKADMLASVSPKGLLIDVKGPLAPGVEFDLDVQAGKDLFSVDGDIKAGIGTIDLGPLGKIKVNTDLEGSLGIRVSSQDLSTAVEAGFQFMGEAMKIDRFSLDARPDSLVHLGDTLKSKVEARLRDEFKDANRWANAAKNGLVDGVDDTEKVLKNVYGKSEGEAKNVAGDIKKGTQSAEKTVAKQASNFGKKIKKLF